MVVDFAVVDFVAAAAAAVVVVVVVAAAAAAVEPENVAAAFAAKRQTLQLFQRTLYLRLKLNYWY